MVEPRRPRTRAAGDDAAHRPAAAGPAECMAGTQARIVRNEDLGPLGQVHAGSASLRHNAGPGCREGGGPGDRRGATRMSTPATGGAPRQGILPLAIKDKGALFNAYMPFVRGGGLFVPTTKRYNLGDEVFILLTVMEEKDRLPVPGKVIWITP